MSVIATQPNEKRCAEMKEHHSLSLPHCCPKTANPQAGSIVEISYTPDAKILEVQSLSDYIASFVGGRGDVRSMEGMIQQIARDCAESVGVKVDVYALLHIHPSQQMRLLCSHP